MMVLIFIASFIVNCIVSHLVGLNGEDRKIGYNTAFIVSFVFSPLIGLLLVLSSKENEETEESITNSKPDNVYIQKDSSFTLEEKIMMIGLVVIAALFALVMFRI